MKIKYAEFIGSFPQYTLCPKKFRPEYAFIGRSNVGKSSLINMLMGRRDLAKVSSKPGKTQMLNYYQIDASWHIVDLPGYGYAKISKTQRAKWEKMIYAYLKHREQLVCAFVLIDANVEPQPLDIEFINTLGQMKIPYVLVYTKMDKAKKTDKIVRLEKNIEAFRSEMLEHWEELPQQFMTSASKGTGKEEILSFIEGLNKEFNEFYENM